jgi:hypothetical protein
MLPLDEPAGGRSRDSLDRQALMATFGIVGKYEEGGIVIVDREHGHDHGPEPGPGRGTPAHAHDHER